MPMNAYQAAVSQANAALLEAGLPSYSELRLLLDECHSAFDGLDKHPNGTVYDASRGLRDRIRRALPNLSESRN